MKKHLYYYESSNNGEFVEVEKVEDARNEFERLFSVEYKNNIKNLDYYKVEFIYGEIEIENNVKFDIKKEIIINNDDEEIEINLFEMMRNTIHFVEEEKMFDEIVYKIEHEYKYNIDYYIEKIENKEEKEIFKNRVKEYLKEYIKEKEEYEKDMEE